MGWGIFENCSKTLVDSFSLSEQEVSLIIYFLLAEENHDLKCTVYRVGPIIGLKKC